MDKCCKNCKWHDSFSWVCVNGDSDYVADFTMEDDVCEEWEEDETLSEL